MFFEVLEDHESCKSCSHALDYELKLWVKEKEQIYV